MLNFNNRIRQEIPSHHHVEILCFSPDIIYTRYEISDGNVYESYEIKIDGKYYVHLASQITTKEETRDFGTVMSDESYSKCQIPLGNLPFPDISFWRAIESSVDLSKWKVKSIKPRQILLAFHNWELSMVEDYRGSPIRIKGWNENIQMGSEVIQAFMLSSRLTQWESYFPIAHTHAF